MGGKKGGRSIRDFLVPCTSCMSSLPHCTGLVLLECLSRGLIAKILETNRRGWPMKNSVRKNMEHECETLHLHPHKHGCRAGKVEVLEV